MPPVATGIPLRIALLGYRSSPYSGGQGVYLKYLSRGLKHLGHEVSVISGPPYPELDEGVALVKLPSLDLYQNGLRSLRTHHLSDRLAIIEWLSKLSGGFAEPWTFGERAREWLLAHRDQFDVVHDNQTLADGIFDIQKAGIPLITTIHHPISRDLRHALQQEPQLHRRLFLRRWHLFLRMQSRVARKLNHLVTVSTPSRDDIVSDFGVDSSRLSVLPNGVDTALYRPLPGVRRHHCQIMAIASADVPMKGLSVLLRAASELLAHFPDLQLLLVAKPRPGGETERLIDALDLSARVRFVSDISDEELVRHYAESTLAVVPSLYEGFGLPAVEAMACGVPLVSSDGGALAEVVGDGGVLVPAGNAGALAGAVAGLLSNPEKRQQLAKRARARAEQRFCWNVCAAKMVDHYRRVIASC
ncbi:glycosyl transferase, group 1 [Luminiphilus syltensis NOR5-1B]|uniref:Glycosyl transferase, group 1 n=1 Tax=Luminiphilus syltensis NOR5-1B TaxID=565045 RepID=B8KUL4_9GAMM|nr:glycosyltransferase family 4 protein [Luminiphilus syltensis]EED36985.1 glycosyl transferase, group 1 [Luminiphilus syltensis NOR5-1B]